MDDQGYTLTDAPIFTPAACEGTTTLFEVDYIDEQKAYLTQSGQLYVEATAAALGKVYCLDVYKRQVVEPAAGNIGGGGFMLIRLSSGKTAFVDYREMAPKQASRDMYKLADGSFDPDGSLAGYRAVAVPGTVAGLALAVRTYGKLSLQQDLQPAIRLADQGFPVNGELARSLESSASTLSRFAVSKRIFLNSGANYKSGDLLRQPELAATLRRIAANGPDEFYHGETAHHLADEMAKNGGIISLDDLAAYAPKVREPLNATYRYREHDWQLITSPPPSSGGVAMIEALNILDPIELKGWDDAQSVHWVAEAMRRVFADRAVWLADSDFVHVPVQGLTLSLIHI